MPLWCRWKWSSTPFGFKQYLQFSYRHINTCQSSKYSTYLNASKAMWENFRWPTDLLLNSLICLTVGSSFFRLSSGEFLHLNLFNLSHSIGILILIYGGPLLRIHVAPTQERTSIFARENLIDQSDRAKLKNPRRIPHFLQVGVLWLAQGTLAGAARFSFVNIWRLRQQAGANLPYFGDIL